MKTPLNIPLSELADSARAAGRAADVEARGAGIEPAGIVVPPTEPRDRTSAEKRVGRSMRARGLARKAVARRGLAG